MYTIDADTTDRTILGVSHGSVYWYRYYRHIQTESYNATNCDKENSIALDRDPCLLTIPTAVTII